MSGRKAQPDPMLDRVLAVVRDDSHAGGCGVADVQHAVGISRDRAMMLLGELVGKGLVAKVGKRFVLAGERCPMCRRAYGESANGQMANGQSEERKARSENPDSVTVSLRHSVTSQEVRR